MAILTTVNWLSEARIEVSDMRRIESAVRNDFDTTVTSVITGTSQGYFVRGFYLNMTNAIGNAANALTLVVDPGAVLHIDASVSGTIFQTPTGTVNQVLNPNTNANVTGSFAANSTNYVGLDYNRFQDESTDTVHYIWSPSSNSEIDTIAPAAQTLTFKIIISTSIWAANVLPIAIVTTDSNGNVTSVTDSRWMLYSLETGGINPNPAFVYPWSLGRTQPPVTATAANPTSPFIGGDKQLGDLKDWMNAIMSELLGIKGTSYWFSSFSSGPSPSIASLFQDLGNTVITGSGEISHGILPNSDPILTTSGTVTSGSNQLSVVSFAGLVAGDFIFGTGIPFGATIVGTPGSTITMSISAPANASVNPIYFYSPSQITAPGQINWDQPISIRVIGSSLTYTIAANPTSADITLSNDQVAYINFVREQPIATNLIVGTAAPYLSTSVVLSIGNVPWTSGLAAGDYIGVVSNGTTGYYQIATLGTSTESFADSAYAVTLVSPVVGSDFALPGGSLSQYAFGSYLAVASPSTNRDIFIANRASVPINKNTYWLLLREDNGGNPRVYVRFVSEELNNGESVQIAGTTSLELLQYIGAASAASSKPEYVAALDPGSVPQISAITVGGGSTITGGQYFLMYSSASARSYAVWFKVSGSGSAPVVPNIMYDLEVDILTGDSSSTVATKLAAVLNTAPFLDFNASAVGAVVTVTNTSAGVAGPITNGNVGAPFSVTVNQTGTGAGNYIVQDGANLTLGIKELDAAIGSIYASLDSPTYDETIEIVVSGATPPTSLNGPISSGTVITLPNNSRISGTPAQYYTVGKGTLMLWLNGQFIDLESGAYLEVGATGAPSNQIQIEIGLVVGDELEIRLNGGNGGSVGQAVGPPGTNGAQGPRGVDAFNAIAISTKIGPTTYSVSPSDVFLIANCASGAVTFNLPSATITAGNTFIFKKSDSSFNYMHVVANVPDLIDGASSISTNTQWESFSLVSDGSSWNRY